MSSSRPGTYFRSPCGPLSTPRLRLGAECLLRKIKRCMQWTTAPYWPASLDLPTSYEGKKVGSDMARLKRAALRENIFGSDDMRSSHASPGAACRGVQRC